MVEQNKTKNLEAGHNNGENEINLLELFAVLFKKRWLIIFIIIICAILVVGIGKAKYKKKYTATASVLLQPPQNSSINEDRRTQVSFKFRAYGNVLLETYNVALESPQLLKKIVLTEYNYTLNGEQKTSNLIDYYKIKNDNYEKREYLASRRVKNKLKDQYNKESFVLTLSYTTLSTELSSEIVNNFIEQLNIFFREKIESSAKRNFSFVKKSMEKAQKELDEARDKLGKFVKKNKQINRANIDVGSKYSGLDTSYYQSKLELNRLEEDAKLKNELFSQISQKYQVMNLELLDNAPTVIVLESAVPPVLPNKFPLIKYLAVGVFLGLVIGSGYVILTNFISIFKLEGTHAEDIYSEIQKDIKKCTNLIFFFKKKK